MRASRPFLVAIDGPAGAGKSTVSRRVAGRLGFTMVDTGALYRAVAWAALQEGIATDDDAGLSRLLASLDVRFEETQGEGTKVLLDGRDVSHEIRTQEISLGASAVSSRVVVREGLLDLQRRLALAAPLGAVLEGRDIGTVVFPEADSKFFLTASVETRAMRRFDELVARREDAVFEEVLEEQIRRDRRDTERPIAPLRAAEDAVVVDSSNRSIDDVVDEIVALVEAKMAELGSGR